MRVHQGIQSVIGQQFHRLRLQLRSFHQAFPIFRTGGAECLGFFDIFFDSLVVLARSDDVAQGMHLGFFAQHGKIGIQMILEIVQMHAHFGNQIVGVNRVVYFHYLGALGPHGLDALFHGRIDFLMIRPGAEEAPQHTDPFPLESLRIEIRCIGGRNLAHRPGRDRIR